MKKTKTYAIAVLTLLIISLVPLTALGDNAPFATNYIYFASPSGDSDIDVTIGDSFRFDLWTEVSSRIDTVCVTNVSYLPAGIVNYVAQTNTVRGSIFWAGYNDGYETFYKRPGTADIHDAQGWTGGSTNNWLWAVQSSSPDYSVNNTDEQTWNVTWTAASVGIATFTIQNYGTFLSGTAYKGADPGTSFDTGTATVHPAATTSFDATLTTPTNVNLVWTKGTGADRTIIRGSKTSYPATYNDGTEIYNNTGTSTSHTIGAGERWYYRAWSYTNNIWSLTYQQDTVLSNSPPTIGTPSPVNGSGSQNLALTWQVPINDPEGDTFDYRISCSNGQFTDVAGSINGTKSLGITGLSYSTLYTIWVNATDSGSGLYTREWFTFSTKANTPIDVTNPVPGNGSTGRPLSFTWYIDVDDTSDDNGKIDYTIECSNGQFTDVSNANPGTKSISLTGLSWSKTYTVWVNATDQLTWDREWYTFATSSNLPPTFGTPSPVNGSTGQNFALVWSLPVTDPNGDTISWTVQCSNGQSLSGGGTSPQNAQISLSGLTFSTLYTVWVNATDPSGSGIYTRAWYTFTTKANAPPLVPDNENPPDGHHNWNPKVGRLQCHVSDPEGQAMLVSFYWGNGTLIGTTTVTSGSLARVDITLNELTTYTWYATANDGYGGITRGPTTGNWTFTTKEYPKGGGGITPENDLSVLVLIGTTPEPGATITVTQAVGTQAVGGPVATASTDPQGTYIFTLKPGNYLVTVSAPGYETQSKTVNLITGTSLVVNLEPIPAAQIGLLLLIIILLIVAFLISYLIIKRKINENIGMLAVVGFNLIAEGLAVFTSNLIIIPIGIILLIIEFLWIRGRR